MSDSDAARVHSSQYQPGANGNGFGWVDLFFCAVLCVGGFVFLRDALYWGRAAYVGSAQYGDAEFWWNGALHFSHGIVAENPNLTYRMGYAAFGGLVAAVCGPDYRVFHQLLLIVFLVTACGLYDSLRGLIGRIAAAAAAVFLVFNPFTAEWLAISTSDGLGLVLNLVALIALIAGVRGELRLRWIAVFGVFLACASLTRPLMTPVIVPAAFTVIVAVWGGWRKVVTALGVMLAAFVLPTVAWMAFMAATTGNFALTGASQDSSSFYAASDPQIQVWRPDMYVPVEESAKKHFRVDRLTSKQINAEFWTLTLANYQRHWRFHAARLWRNAYELARFTPQRSATATTASEGWRTTLKWSLTLALTALLLWQRRWIAAGAIVALGAGWAIWPPSHPWLVLGASALGLLALTFGRRGWFVWAAYWWVGVLALYLTGGTWGPPLGAAQDLNALGYRLGSQFFFAADVLVIGLLGCIAHHAGHSGAMPASRTYHFLIKPSPLADRIACVGLKGFLALLAALLGLGVVIVTSRLIGRARQAPVTYPSLSALASFAATRGAAPLTENTPLHVAINAHSGAPLLTRAMSSGFIWNLPGQQRCILLLYQQNLVQPVRMNPYRFDVEVSQHLPDRAWMERQGAWLVRSFPDTAQVSNLPYYLEMPAVQAFIPLSADGKSYDTAHATIFPLAKSATQLAASGELVFHGLRPEWATSSGPLKYPRRFALRRAEAANPAVEFTLDLSHARGKKDLRFGIQLEAGPGSPPRSQPCMLRLVPDPADDGPPPGPTTLVPGADVSWNAPSLDSKSGILHFTCDNLRPSDTLWFYEFVLTAYDFAP